MPTYNNNNIKRLLAYLYYYCFTNNGLLMVVRNNQSHKHSQSQDNKHSAYVVLRIPTISKHQLQDYCRIFWDKNVHTLNVREKKKKNIIQSKITETVLPYGSIIHMYSTRACASRRPFFEAAGGWSMIIIIKKWERKDRSSYASIADSNCIQSNFYVVIRSCLRDA